MSLLKPHAVGEAILQLLRGNLNGGQHYLKKLLIMTPDRIKKNVEVIGVQMPSFVAQIGSLYFAYGVT